MLGCYYYCSCITPWTVSLTRQCRVSMNGRCIVFLFTSLSPSKVPWVKPRFLMLALLLTWLSLIAFLFSSTAAVPINIFRMVITTHIFHMVIATNPPNHAPQPNPTQLICRRFIFCFWWLAAVPINIFHGGYRSGNAPIRVSYHGNSHYNAVVDPEEASVGQVNKSPKLMSKARFALLGYEYRYGVSIIATTTSAGVSIFSIFRLTI